VAQAADQARRGDREVTEEKTYAEAVRQLHGDAEALAQACRAADLDTAERLGRYPEPLLASLDALTAEIVKTGIRFPLAPDAALLADAARVADAPVFLTGVHKSGTTLLQHLCDNHPQLLVYPLDGRLGYDTVRRAIGEGLSDCGARIAAQFITHTILPRMRVTRRPRWLLSAREGDVEPYIEFARRFFGFHATLPRDVGGLFRCAAAAYYATQASERRTAVRRWAHKATTYFREAEALARLFPQARFVQIVRHPCAVYGAQKRRQPVKGRLFSPFDEIKAIETSFRMARANLDRLGPARYQVVRYEDLTADPESVMRKVAGFLGICYDDILIRPTQRGRDAQSNTAYEGQHNRAGTISTETVERWKSELSSLESDFVLSMVASAAAPFGYGASAGGSGRLAGVFRLRREYAGKTEIRNFSAVETARLAFRFATSG